MIRRIRRALSSLSKNLSRVTLIGGDNNLSSLCMGFYCDEEGLKLCPAPSDIPANTVMSADGLYSVERCEGFVLLNYTSGRVGLFNKGTLNTTFITMPKGEPFSVMTKNERGSLLVSVVSSNKIGVYDCGTGETDTYDLPSTLYGGIIHCGRLFAADKGTRCKVVWSGFGVTEWEDGIDGSGYVILNSNLGSILKLENLGDNVLCILEKGFTVIKGFADSRNYRISPSQYTVCVGEKVNLGGVIANKYYFSTGDGLYSFDGDTVSREYAVDSCLTDVGRVYVLDDGYVYCDCTYNGEACIMRYDRRSGKASFFGKGCSCPFMSEGELLCVKDGKFYSMSAQNAEEGRIWRSQPIGECGRKTLKNLYVDSDGTPEITVVGGGVRRVVKGTGRIPVNLAGDVIYVEISGNSPVRSVVAEWEARK
ncbi:MAG: hypothetical protein ACI4VK_04610 [Candidatus Coproplasma sp.]